MIDVALEVEDMYFDAEVCAIVDGRAIADVQHPFPFLSVHEYANGIYTNGGNQLVGEINAQICGGETYLASHLVTIDHGTFQEVVLA